ncbi:GNAT family N-acetyltransferase [Edaphobacter aggregans]|uniref:GNAT family N-acetyltransferase n=1 Tax=Edaphobacter aggregans TaxID=570835 RepID=UPI00068E3F37|nr:GNAT family protein [Edaphobacter aggregans]
MSSPLIIKEIRTLRLALVAITPDTILAEQAADGDFHLLGAAIGCTIHPEWPPIHWEPHVLTFMLNQFAAHPDQASWHRYVALPEPNGARTLIGCLGAFAKDDPPATCEIGYSILPSFEGRGYATEGTRALIDHLRADTRITSIIAHTFPSLTGSIRVMEKCGLVFDGDGAEPGTIRYRLRLRP